jgi:type VI protein secretion system component VasK
MEEYTFHYIIIGTGALCIIAAIVGGGLSLNVVSIPNLSKTRQLILGIFGAGLLAFGLWKIENPPIEQEETSQSQSESQNTNQGDTSTKE